LLGDYKIANINFFSITKFQLHHYKKKNPAEYMTGMGLIPAFSRPRPAVIFEANAKVPFFLSCPRAVLEVEDCPQRPHDPIAGV